jgi:NitT/TauT family transport system permease protein
MQSTNDKPNITRSRFFIAKILKRISPVLTFGVVLLAWHVVTALEIYPEFIIPRPMSVFEAFQDALASGILLDNTMTTLEEMLYGLFFGVSIGLLVGYAIAKIPLLEQILSPIIVAFQSTPIVAYAPLLIIWFGSGTTSKIVTAAVIVFFPTLINTIVGIRSVTPQLKDLMRSLNATHMQVFTRLEIPSALPMVLAGLKTSATLAVIGAVVGEFVSSGSGLGYLVTLARNQYDTPLVIVTVLTMTVIALSLYSFVVFLEWHLLAWQRRSSH